MDGDEDNDEDKKFQVDVGQITQDFVPVHTAEEKEQENQSEEEDNSQPNDVFSHDESQSYHRKYTKSILGTSYLIPHLLWDCHASLAMTVE